MIIRPERKSEFTKIYELVKAAFLTAKVSNGKEQGIPNPRIRCHPKKYHPARFQAVPK